MAFPKLNWFTEIEFFDPATMHVAFLVMIDKFRVKLGRRMDITSSNRPNAGHVSTSDHDKGCAIDFKTPATPLEVWTVAKAMGFGGIGLYRTWDGRFYYHIANYGKNNGQTWIGLLQEDGKTVTYLTSTPANLKKYFNI